MTPDLTDEELRRRYLNWCSSQVAKRFLEMSLDDVWLRSQLAATIPEGGHDPLSDSSQSLLDADRIPGYLELVRRTALLLAEEMNLPDFNTWKDRYLAGSEPYENDIISG